MEKHYYHLENDTIWHRLFETKTLFDEFVFVGF